MKLRTALKFTDLCSGRKRLFDSVIDASRELCVSHSSISRGTLKGFLIEKVNRCYVVKSDNSVYVCVYDIDSRMFVSVNRDSKFKRSQLESVSDVSRDYYQCE